MTFMRDFVTACVANLMSFLTWYMSSYSFSIWSIWPVVLFQFGVEQLLLFSSVKHVLQPLKRPNYSIISRVATSFRALMSSGVISPGCGSYHLHFIKARCETSLISQQTRSFHDASSWVGGVVDVSPIRSCQELSEDRIQTLGQERPGQPAVTPLTLAETIHLAQRGPPWVERNSPGPKLHSHERRNVHTLVDMFYVHIHTWLNI